MRTPGYGATIKDKLTGAQKRKPAESFRNFRENFDRAFDLNNDRQHMTDHALEPRK